MSDSAFLSFMHVRQRTLTRPLAPADTRVAAGLKAAIHNPHVSEQAKERAQDRLENINASIPTERDSTFPVGTTDPNGHELNRVLGGYKATLHSMSPFLGVLRDHSADVALQTRTSALRRRSMRARSLPRPKEAQVQVPVSRRTSTRCTSTLATRPRSTVRVRLLQLVASVTLTLDV